MDLGILKGSIAVDRQPHGKHPFIIPDCLVVFYDGFTSLAAVFRGCRRGEMPLDTRSSSNKWDIVEVDDLRDRQLPGPDPWSK